MERLKLLASERGGSRTLLVATAAVLFVLVVATAAFDKSVRREKEILAHCEALEHGVSHVARDVHELANVCRSYVARADGEYAELRLRITAAEQSLGEAIAKLPGCACVPVKACECKPAAKCPCGAACKCVKCKCGRG